MPGKEEEAQMNAKEKAEEIAEIACFRDFCTCEINVVKLIELALTEARIAGMREAAEIASGAAGHCDYEGIYNGIRQAADEIEKRVEMNELDEFRVLYASPNGYGKNWKTVQHIFREFLKSKKSRLVVEFVTPDIAELRARAEKLEARIGKLREAMELIAHDTHSGYELGPGVTCECYAHKALKEDDKHAHSLV